MNGFSNSSPPSSRQLSVTCAGSLQSRIFPSCHKYAFVLSRLGKPSFDPECLASYRPTSNLPFHLFILKVVERVVTKCFPHRWRSHTTYTPPGLDLTLDTVDCDHMHNAPFSWFNSNLSAPSLRSRHPYIGWTVAFQQRSALGPPEFISRTDDVVYGRPATAHQSAQLRL